MAIGDRLYVVYDVVDAAFSLPTSGSFGFEYQQSSECVIVKTAFRLPSSVAKSFRYYVVASKLLEQITGISGVLQSTVLNTPNLKLHECYPYNVRLTCGDALRNLTATSTGTLTNPKIRISWADLWKDMRSRFGLGYSVENGKVIIERAEYFFDANQIIEDLGEVSEFNDEPARDYFAASGKWGYPTQTYDKLNGRDEPNTTAIYKYPVDRITVEEDNLCPVRTDPYGIEYTRFNLSGKKTTDASTDNETFAIETNYLPSTVSLFGFIAVSVYTLYRPQNSVSQPSDTGFLFPATMYNLTMMPVLNLLRSGNMLHSALYNRDSEYIKFQTTGKNEAVKINLGSGLIQASADIQIGSLDPIAFKPYVFHVKAVARQTMLEAMKLRPHGCFSFTSQGIPYKGFPMEVGIDSPDDNSYMFSLLCTPDTDVLPLVQ